MSRLLTREQLWSLAEIMRDHGGPTSKARTAAIFASTDDPMPDVQLLRAVRSAARHVLNHAPEQLSPAQWAPFRKQLERFLNNSELDTGGRPPKHAGGLVEKFTVNFPPGWRKLMDDAAGEAGLNRSEYLHRLVDRDLFPPVDPLDVRVITVDDDELYPESDDDE